MHVDGGNGCTQWIVVLINLPWWIVGLPAHGVLLRDGYPCQLEATAVVDCSVRQSAVMECGFEVHSSKNCDSYRRRWQVTAVRSGL